MKHDTCLTARNMSVTASKQITSLSGDCSTACSYQAQRKKKQFSALLALRDGKKSMTGGFLYNGPVMQLVLGLQVIHGTVVTGQTKGDLWFICDYFAIESRIGLYTHPSQNLSHISRVYNEHSWEASQIFSSGPLSAFLSERGHIIRDYDSAWHDIYFCVTVPLCRESISDCWIPRK